MTSNRSAVLAGTLSLILVAAPVVLAPGAYAPAARAAESAAAPAPDKPAEAKKNVDAPKTIVLHHPGYVFELPEGFLAADSAIQINGERVGAFDVNINAMVQNLPTPMTLQDFTDVSKKQLAMQGTLVSEGAMDLGGFPGGFAVVELVGQDKQVLKAKTVYTVTGTKAYMMTYTATKDTYEKYLPAADKAFATFKIR